MAARDQVMRCSRRSPAHKAIWKDVETGMESQASDAVGSFGIEALDDFYRVFAGT
jgi:hypothetical protein